MPINVGTVSIFTPFNIAALLSSRNSQDILRTQHDRDKEGVCSSQLILRSQVSQEMAEMTNKINMKWCKYTLHITH